MTVPTPPGHGVPAFVGCVDCLAYVNRRGDVVLPHIRDAARRRGEDVRRVASRFVAGVHRRHTEGLPL